MSHHPHKPEVPPGPAAGDARARLLERRRLLLKGLGKSSAVVAAAAPLQALATGKLLTKDNLLCSTSGMHSVVRSNLEGAVYCKGYKLDRYKSKNKWPGYGSTKSGEAHFACGGKTVSTEGTCKFKNIFGGSLDKSLWSIVNGTNGTDVDRVWIVALLNAEWHRRDVGLGLNFPYLPTEVLSMWGGPDATYAVTLFAGYLMDQP